MNFFFSLPFYKRYSIILSAWAWACAYVYAQCIKMYGAKCILPTVKFRQHMFICFNYDMMLCNIWFLRKPLHLKPCFSFRFEVKYEKWIDTAVAGGNCSFLEHFFPHARTCNEMNSLFAQRTFYTSALLKWSVYLRYLLTDFMVSTCKKYKHANDKSENGRSVVIILKDRNFSGLFSECLHLNQ